MFADIKNNFDSVCELLEIQPGLFIHFYPELKVNSPPLPTQLIVVEILVQCWEWS